jgi:NAD+ kinase
MERFNSKAKLLISSTYSGGTMKNIGININTTKDRDEKILNGIKQVIKEQIPHSQVHVYRDTEGLDTEKTRELDIVIALGGDGTILRTARILAKYEIPIIGVNIGNLGFLAGVECSEFEWAIRKLKEGAFTVEERMMLQCTLKNNKGTFVYNSLNDIVISKGTLSRIVRYDISVDNHFYTCFSADGVIISTPTGSTAYSFSAGGPIIYPNLSLIEITPICPHSPGIRTLVLDSKSEVGININKITESVFLTVDGQESLQLDDFCSITIGLSEWKCKIIRLENYNYFDVLREKIIWRTRECEGDRDESSTPCKNN